jgi:hypothetical protein
MHKITPLLALLSTVGLVSAQVGGGISQPTPLPPVIQAWGPGATTALVAGRFLPNHPGMSLVGVRNSEIIHAFQPAEVAHQFATAIHGVRCLATLKGDGYDPDLLALVNGNGLWIAEYGQVGFASESLAELGDWSSVRKIQARRMELAGQPVHVIVGLDDADVLRLAVRHADGSLNEIVALPIAGGLRDACFVEWTGGGTLELAVLSGNALSVFDWSFALLLHHVVPNAAGLLAPSSIETGDPVQDQAIQDLYCVASAATNGPWYALRVGPGYAPAFELTPLLASGALRGITAGDLSEIGPAGSTELILTDATTTKRIVAADEIGLGLTGGPDIFEFEDLDQPGVALGAPLACGAVLADLNQDGGLDMAYASNPHAALAVMLEPLQPFGSSPPNEGLYFQPVVGLGHDPETADLEGDFESVFTQRVGIRLALPTDVAIEASTRVSLTLWALTDETVPATSEVSPKAVGNFLFTIPAQYIGPAQSTAPEIDLVMPLPGDLPMHTRYYMELRLVSFDGGKIKALTPVTWIAQAQPLPYFPDEEDIQTWLLGSTIAAGYCANMQDPPEPYTDPWNAPFAPTTDCSRLFTYFGAQKPTVFNFDELLADVPPPAEVGPTYPVN